VQKEKTFPKLTLEMFSPIRNDCYADHICDLACHMERWFCFQEMALDIKILFNLCLETAFFVAQLKTNQMYLLSVILDIADLVMKAKEPVRPYYIKNLFLREKE